MKKIVTIILLLTLFIGVGCERIIGRRHTDFELGKGKLVDENAPIEAAHYLEKALKKDPQNVEAHCYLVIAYRRAEDDVATKLKGNKDVFVEKRDQQLEELKKVSDLAMEELITIIRDPNRRVQRDAIQVIVDLGAPAAQPLIDEYIKNVKEDYRGIDNEIIEMLTKIGSAAVPSLIKTLGDSNAPVLVRREIARILGEIGDARARQELEKQLSATDSGLKMEVAIALYKLSDKQYADTIIAGLDSPNVSARCAASRALITMNESPTDKLIEALSDQEPEVRACVAKALGKHPRKQSIDHLIRAIKNDKDEQVKNAIAEALTELGAKYGEYIVEVLVKELGVIADWKVRVRVVNVLADTSVIDNFDQDTAYLLFKYNQDKEDHPTVQAEINKLLNQLDQKGI